MSATEEISRYFDATNAYYSPTLSRRPAASNYDFPEKSQKKDKKWSIGSLFRRKKKNDSDSSSEENVSKKGFLRKKRKPTDKRKKPVKVVGTFDHVVLPACQNLQIPVYHVEDYSTGVLSDPTTYSCSAYRDRLSTPTVFQRESRNRQQNSEKDIFNQRENKRSPSAFAHGSLDNLGRRSRRELTKARVEARRDVKCGSSSDEDSQRSHSSSRFISDESLTKSHRDGSLSRRSRAARTERYIRRISREEENILRSKSDAESRNIHGAFCRKPVGIQVVSERNIGTCLSHSSFSGLSTVPLNHKLTSNSYKPINSSNYNTKENLILNNHVPSELHLSNRRSLSCDSHIHKAVTSDATAEHICFAVPNLMQNPEAVIRASSNYVHRQPPPPPPRDPRRLTVVLSGEGSRPTSYSFERGRHGYKSTFDNNANELGKADFHQWNTNCRSTSEDNLPCQPIGKLPPRPSSATPDTEQQRTPKRQPENLNCFQNFQYLTDRNPRSRKPIFIQCSSENDDYCKSISQKSLDFWKQKDQEELHRRKESTVPKSGSSSPQMFTSQTRVRSKVFLPDSAADQRSEVSAPQPEAGGVHVAETAMTNTPNTSSKQSSDSAKDNVTKRKSTNLEEALDELEAIYNSLRLGDEDLLERAEQREMSAAAEKLIQSKAEVYPSWSTSRGAMSDSSYSYEPFETADQHRRKRFLKKSHVADRKTDDMAFRKLNKERFATISDPQSVVSKVSYLLATPAYDSYDDNNLEQSNKKSIEKEPDITLDDVVYRTIKHANNTLKVVDPQPPFGIPLGPVSPAANSDYLHAVPDPTPTFVKNQKIPDIVKDDLAFRNLRKDDNKEPALPPLNGEDITNNNACRPDLNYMKKKRAIRSLSANISNLVDGESQQEISEKPVSNTGNDNQSLTDIADVMEFARQVLREKESKINASRAGFLSDTEANKIRYKLQLTNRETPKSKRLSFLNELRCGGAKNARNESSQHKVQVHVPSHKEKLLHSRPPRSSTADRKAKSPTKESTPIPLSPLEEKMQLRNDDESASIDTLLKAIAVEAKETSDRIAATLTNCNDSENSENGNAANEIDNVKISENLKTDDCVNVNIQLSNLDECSDHAKMCKKLLECVAGSTPEAEQSSSEINTPSSTTDDAKQPDTTVDGERCVNENSDSEHDYENISGNENDNPSSVLNNRDTESKSDKDQGHHNDKVVSNSPDLVKVSDESTEVDKDCSVNTLGDSESKSVEREDEKGEKCVGVLSYAALSDNTKECALLTENYCMDASNHIVSFQSSHYGDVQAFGLQKREACITHKASTSSTCCVTKREEIRCFDQFDEGKSNLRNVRDSRHTLNKLQPTRSWYCDPVIVAIACIYGLACIHQLASMNLIFVLSIVLAALAVVVSLIL